MLKAEPSTRAVVVLPGVYMDAIEVRIMALSVSSRRTSLVALSPFLSLVEVTVAAIASESLVLGTLLLRPVVSVP